MTDRATDKQAVERLSEAELDQLRRYVTSVPVEPTEGWRDEAVQWIKEKSGVESWYRARLFDFLAFIETAMLSAAPKADEPKPSPGFSTPSPRVSVEEIARSLETAPTDGTMVRLLVDYSDEANAAEIKRLDGKGYIWPWTPLDDADHAWTIGFNSFENAGEPGWKFVGWDWSQDVFCDGRGKPIGWLPWENPEAPAQEGAE